MVSYILFDLDNTLYPESSGFQNEIGRRMTAYVSRYLEVSLEEAAALRQQEAVQYGTTLKWLIAEHGFEKPDEFLEEVHPRDVAQFLEQNIALAETLSSLPQPKSVLTNSPGEHAERVLEYLDIKRFFEHVFDLRFHNFVGKPAMSSYGRVLEMIGKEPREVLFIDDLPEYLLPFREMGGQVVCIDETGSVCPADIPSIRSITELPGFIRGQQA